MSNTIDILVEGLQNAGTSFIAGVPGEQASLDAIESARKRGMRFILTKHETPGAILAATWGEITGAPGACIATRGPGVANLVNGIAHAWMDRCPLVAMTDQYAAPAFLTGSHMRLDQAALFAPITKWSTTIDARTVRQQIRRAIRTATAHAPGPVHLAVPVSEKSLEAGAYVDAPLVPETAAIVPDTSALKTSLDRLKAARRPLLLAGLGVLWDDACAGLAALAERLGAPVLTTAKCKGAIPEDHPLSTGCLRGGALERDLIAEADLIVTVGLDAVELHAAAWPYAAPVLSLSSVPWLDGEIPITAEAIGNLAGILDVLARSAPEGANWGERASREFRAATAAQLDTPSRGLSPQRLFEVARSVLPRDTVASFDAGARRSIGAQKWLAYGPKEFLASNGLATMGYAMPAAMAARIVHPGRPVVAFSGDGGFLMAASELQTSVREKLPVTVVVLDDGELGAMRVRQDLRGMQRYGTQLGGIDWEHLARGFGAEGTVVDTENALGDALSRAAGSGTTTLIAARLDASGYVAQFKAMWGNRDAS
jgi:acetolactate synthase-1/2/3 large subunit